MTPVLDIQNTAAMSDPHLQAAFLHGEKCGESSKLHRPAPAFSDRPKRPALANFYSLEQAFTPAL